MESSARARADVEAALWRLQRLQAFTEALATALTSDDVVRVGDAVGGLYVVRNDRPHPGLPPALAPLVATAIAEDAPAFAGSTGAVPLSVRGRIDGALAFAWDDDDDVDDDDRSLAQAMARQCSLALERCRLFRDEAAARQRTAVLQTITAGLARARDVDEASAAVVDVVADAIGCSAGWLAIDQSKPAEPGTRGEQAGRDGEVVLVNARGKDKDVSARWRRFSRQTPGPVRDVLDKKAPLYFASADDYAAPYPAMADDIRREGHEAAALLPIELEGVVRAVLTLRFSRHVDFDAAWHDLLTAVAAQCGLALERAQLLEAERTARSNLGFLLEASRMVSSSLDVERTLQTLTELIVPRLADWCGIELLGDDGQVRLQGLAHREPEKALRLRALREQFPVDPSSRQGVPEVMRTGVAAMTSDVTDAMLQHADYPAGYLDVLRDVGLRSTMVVPLSEGGVCFGVIAFVLGEGPRRFGAAELAVAEDIAARASTAIVHARRHRELERAKNDLDDALRSKDEFLALLGHELRNPLMPITTALELMSLRGVQGAERERAVIERQARHLVRLVDDLLDVTRITRGRVTLEKKPLEVAVALSRALETTSPAIERGGHHLGVDVAERGLQVLGDEDRLVQVFANLINNAAKYTQRGGELRVSARADGRDVVVEVADNGKGMSADLVPRVFELFVQGPRTIDRAEGGLGLGLAIVKNLVELHDGTVSAASGGPGQGSCFSVRLPRIDTLAPTPSSGIKVASLIPQRRRRVLVVDDNEDLAHELRSALEALGQEVAVAHDGPQALALVERFAPEMALLDVGLPVMDGYELAGRLKARFGGDVVLVAITGYGQASDRQRALDAGFDQHHVKPVGMARLVEILEDAD